MYRNNARLLLMVGSTIALVACQDGVTDPTRIDAPRGLSATIGGCGGWQAQNGVQSLSYPPTLTGVTVTATYNGVGGMPWNIMQQMQFPLGSGADNAPCLNTPTDNYGVEVSQIAQYDTIPTPAGVDAGWWRSLSPREQRALLDIAQLYMRLYPNLYASPGAVINEVFADPMKRAKVDSKVRANDFQLPGIQGEMLAGGIYGCTLYQSFVRLPSWILSNDETRTLVTSLVTAFAESEYAPAPLRALRFGRNGAFGAGLAQMDGWLSDCGSLVFNSIAGGSIILTDPYTDGSTPPPTGGGGGRVPPSDGGLPPGWYDF